MAESEIEDEDLSPEETRRRRKKYTLLAVLCFAGYVLASMASEVLFGDNRLLGALLAMAVGVVCLGNVWLNVRDYGHAELLGDNVDKGRNRAAYWGFVGFNVLVGVGLLVIAVYLVFREQTPGE